MSSIAAARKRSVKPRNPLLVQQKLIVKLHCVRVNNVSDDESKQKTINI